MDAAATEAPNPVNPPVEEELPKEKPDEVPPKRLPPDPPPKVNVDAAEDVAVAVDEEKEKIPLFDSASDEEVEAAEEEVAREEDPPKTDAPPPPNENNPALLDAADVGGADAAAPAGVTEVVKVSLGFSPEEETQKEKVGFMKELQLLVGARVWDRLEKENV